MNGIPPVGLGPIAATGGLAASSARVEKASASSPPATAGDEVRLDSLPPLETTKSAVDVLASGYGYAEFPQCSPDGKKIIFNSVHDYETSQMLVMRADGSHVRSLFTGEKLTPENLAAFMEQRKGHIDEQGTWSHDGDSIYYRSNERGTFGIARFDVEAETSDMVVHDPNMNLKHPEETEDGFIVGYGGPPGKKYKTSEEFSDLFLANPEDGTYQLITHSDGSVAYKHPSLFHGQVVAHREPRGGDNPEGGNADLILVDPKTGVERNLTQTPDADERHPFFNEKVGLMAFHSDETSDKNLWISTPDTSRRCQLTHYGKAAQSPCWSPDGQKIYFVKKLERQAEGEPFFARQAEIRVIDVSKALEDLTDQARKRLHDLEDRGAGKALVEQAKESYEDYRWFRNKYRDQ